MVDSFFRLIPRPFLHFACSDLRAGSRLSQLPHNAVPSQVSSKLAAPMIPELLANISRALYAVSGIHMCVDRFMLF